MLNSALILAIYFTLSTGWAVGDSKSNGGNVIICNEKTPQQTIEVLDLYEARVLRNLYLSPQFKGNNRAEILEQALAVLTAHSPRRAAQYRQEFVNFFNPEHFKKNTTLVSSNDSFHVAIPTGCRPVDQVVTQLRKVISTDPDYVVNQDIWDQMEPLQQAVLAMHEVILKEAIHSGQTDSVRSRLMNSYLWTGKISKMSQKEFFDFISLEMKFNFTDNGPFRVQIHDENGTQYYNSLYIKGKAGSYFLAKGEDFKTPLGILHMAQTSKSGEAIASNLVLDEHDQLVQAQIENSFLKIAGQKLEINGTIIMHDSQRPFLIEVVDRRVPGVFDLMTAAPNCLRYHGPSGSLCLVDRISWNIKGALSGGSPAEVANLKLATGETIKVGPIANKKFLLSFGENHYPNIFVNLEAFVMKKTGQLIPRLSWVQLSPSGEIISVYPDSSAELFN